MVDYIIVYSTAEVKWTDRKDIVLGCTIEVDNEFTEIGPFATLEDARANLKNKNSTVCRFDNGIFFVEEYTLYECELDEEEEEELNRCLLEIAPFDKDSLALLNSL